MPMGGNSTGAACGDVKFWPASSAPAGWLKANGAAVSRTTYAALFAIIGTTYGVGDGSTTFNVPDLRGEFVRAFDDGRGVDFGRAIGTAQSAATGPPAGGVSESVWKNAVGATVAAGASYTVANLAWDAETRPRNVAMLACIKY